MTVELLKCRTIKRKKNSMKNLILMSFLATLLMSSSCCNHAKSVSELASLGLRVVALLQDCAELSEMFSIKVAKVNNGLKEGINSNRSVLDLGKYWEKYWGDIHSDYDDLRHKLIRTNSTSQEYFAELYKNNSQISNPDLKERDMKKTLELRDKYEKEYTAALTSLEKAQKVLREGDDILLVLKNNVLRSALQEQITVLNNIKVESDVFARRIKSFSTNCIPLFEQNQ